MCYLSRVNHDRDQPRFVADLLDQLASRGRHHFTTQEVASALGSSLVAARAALRRLRQKRRVAKPYRGFHVIVPSEYRRLGCLPPEQFIPQLMAHLGQRYYGALLTAARYHGAAHQQPQIFQVMVAKSRKPIICGDVHVAFVARSNIVEVATIQFNTPRGELAVSAPEATAFDLVGNLAHAGGMDNVATVLFELAEKIDPNRLVLAAQHSPIPWAQRLGYLLDHIGARDKAELLQRHVARVVNETALLVPGRNPDGACRDARWRLAVNYDVEPDL